MKFFSCQLKIFLSKDFTRTGKIGLSSAKIPKRRGEKKETQLNLEKTIIFTQKNYYKKIHQLNEDIDPRKLHLLISGNYMINKLELLTG